MAAHWDNRNSRPILSNHNGYHGQTTTFQPPFPEHLGNTRPSVPPVPEFHGPATLYGPSLAENNTVTVPYYEGYTIRPDDLASSEDRWLVPARKSIPATQEDLHTEVIRQRQSGRTACRELEDCHGPKRQYIDRLIRERNASTSLGHFEVAQLRLERVPKDSGKASTRNSGRNYHARDYKPKDLTKPRQKTVYMHIILLFIKDPNMGLAGIPPDKFAPRNLNVDNSHRNAKPHSTDEDIFIPSLSSDDQSPVLPEVNHRPVLARRCTYATGSEQYTSPSSSRYISRGTQTTLPAHTGSYSDWCSSKDTDDTTRGDAFAEDTWTTTSNVDKELPQNPPSSDDEVVSMGDSAVAHEFASESTEEEVRGFDEYEKPPWFQNLQPVKTPGVTDEQSDVCDQQDSLETLTTHEENVTDGAGGPHDEELLEAHGEKDNDCLQPNISSCSGERIGQRAPDTAAGHTECDDNDQSPDCAKSAGAPIIRDVRRLDLIDEHASSGPTKIPVSEYHSNLPQPLPPEKLPPSERYKPRPPLNLIPSRPSLTRASATYDSRSTDDSERKCSKRVSFQQAATPLYTPPSTTTSSPVSPSASPKLPFWTVFSKPPPVNIPPGQYTPIASSTPVSPLSPPAVRKPYTCLEPTCESSFDHPYDRDRHERQHEIGDPPYSECPICHYSRSSGAAVDVGLREMLVAHISRRH